MLADEFLDLYKKLEQTLKVKYQGQNGAYENQVTRYSMSPEGSRYQQELDAMRQLRNLLQHLPKTGGQYIAEPSEEIIQKLKFIISEIENPKKAMSVATRKEQLLCCTLQDKAYPIMTQMEKRGHTHVPLIENGRVTGVFSKNVVFSYLINNKLREEMLISDFADLLKIEKHGEETYFFAHQNAFYDNIRDLFESRITKGKPRLAAVFLTDNGKQDGILRGMITSWDVFKDYS